MESDKNTAEISNNSTVTRTDPESAEDIINDLIQKASLVEGSSEEEYLSAEEEDENDNAYVINSLNREADVPAEDSNESLDTNERDQDTEEKEEDVVDEMEERRKEEESLSEEESMARREKGQAFKDNGNIEFRNANYKEAISEYTNALDICPLNFHKERAIMFANRAACKMKEDALEAAISDSSRAIELHPQYLKAILRRAELYEKTEKLDEALKDYEAVIELDPGQHLARAACMRLQEQIKERNEKLKVEMMGKLKDLGNLVLRPFGLSTNNFKLQQDQNSGSYSVQFQQSPAGNGS